MIGSPPLPSRSPRVDEIVAAARRLLEDEPFDAVTMRRLADELGIQAPSLYKHVANKRALEVLLVENTFVEIGDALHTVVAQPGNRTPVAAVGATYRRYGKRHPHLYRLVTGGGFPRDELTPGVDEWAGEAFFLAVGDQHRSQAFWAFCHGMTILEIDGRFPPSSQLTKTWAEGLAGFEPR
jgi:AcrR family transcriptional regulator